MKRKYWAILVTTIIIILISDDIRLRIAKSKTENDLSFATYLAGLREETVNKLKQTNAAEIAQLQVKMKEISPRYESAISRLKRMGLNDPVNIIRKNLIQHQDLIPNRDMPKGKVCFQQGQISIINSRWVLAYYENGYFDGELLLRMTVGKNSEISWKVLDDYR